MKTSGTIKEAEAAGFIHLRPETVRMIKDNEPEKEEVISLAETSGTEAAKKTALLVPLMHAVELSSVEVKAYIFPNGIEIKSLIRSVSQFGVEVEALAAVSASLLNLYEKFKTIDSSMVISDIKILRRTPEEK